MTSLEKRLQHLEMRLNISDGPSYADRLRVALIEARERQRLGLTLPLPEGDDPLSRRRRQAMIRTQQARARLQAGAPGPW